MTEKEYQALHRKQMYDQIQRLRNEEHLSIQRIADRLGINFRTVKRYLEMSRLTAGTFVSAMGGTFDSDIPGTFESATGGTFNPLLSLYEKKYKECLLITAVAHRSGA